MTDQHLDRHRRECEEMGCVEFFDRLVGEGKNSGFAAMLAQRRPSGTKGTDRAFLEGSHGAMDKVGKFSRERMLKMAKKAGISTQGKVYKGGLGRPDDHMAWVSGRDDVLAACKAKGLTCSGSVNYKSPEQEPKRKKIAEDIVQNFMAVEVAKDPGLREKVQKNRNQRMELREKVIEKHGNPKVN